MVSRVSESELVIPKTQGKLLMENTFGSLTLDRSNLLYSINNRFSNSKSLSDRLNDLTETINALRPDPDSIKKLFAKKSIVGLLEAYLNHNDDEDAFYAYHNRMVEYLNDYFNDDDKRRTNRDKSRKDLLKKHFDIDTDDLWKDSYKDYLKSK